MKRAQVTIEFTLALILMMVLLFGIAKILIWGARSLVNRHQYYESTRIDTTENFGHTDYVWDKEEANLEMDLYNK